MQKLDTAFLFESGDSAREIKRVSDSDDPIDAYLTLSVGKEAINQIVHQSVYSAFFRAPLLAAVAEVNAAIDAILLQIIPPEGEAKPLTPQAKRHIRTLYGKFETILISELQSLAVYMVTRKSGFDGECMVESGQVFFPEDLGVKVPEAVKDAEQAMRCIAFELPTAAGFHLHRANEAVLRRYWDSVTNNAQRPKQNNMGDYLRELDKMEKGKKTVREHIRAIKDFHRNPLMHPDERLEKIDEAIDLLAAVRCCIGYMLTEIPVHEVVTPCAPPPPPALSS